jgi:multidrug efflux pump subunit AcrB
MWPVMMAASTTILGMAPLLSDVFFLDMAVVIMFGLGFTLALTLNYCAGTLCYIPYIK